MSRKPPSDSFTRFTSTAPPSAPKPNPSSANGNFSASSFSPNTHPTSQPQAPRPSSTPNETPAERVARLRAAHRANIAATQLSFADRLISRGRSVADIAHRATTYTLLIATGVSTIIAAYGLVSLVGHNRRQKRAWIEREMDRLADAQRAFLRGEANAEQLHLLEQERAGEEIANKFKADKERRKREGTWNRVKGTFGGFMGQGDMGVETRDRAAEIKTLGEQVEAAAGRVGEAVGAVGEGVRRVAVQEGVVKGTGLDEKGRPVPIGKLQRVTRDAEPVATESVRRQPVKGGMFDVLAENVTQGASGGWWSWTSKGSDSSSASRS